MIILPLPEVFCVPRLFGATSGSISSRETKIYLFVLFPFVSIRKLPSLLCPLYISFSLIVCAFFCRFLYVVAQQGYSGATEMGWICSYCLVVYAPSSLFWNWREMSAKPLFNAVKANHIPVVSGWLNSACSPRQIRLVAIAIMELPCVCVQIQAVS